MQPQQFHCILSALGSAEQDHCYFGKTNNKDIKFYYQYQIIGCLCNRWTVCLIKEHLRTTRMLLYIIALYNDWISLVKMNQ